MKVTGVVLAGGQSKRMGQNKALMDFNGKPLIAHVLNNLKAFTDGQMIIGDPSLYGAFGVPVFADQYQGKGPLAGLHSALLHSNTDLNFIVGCDMPNIDESILDHISQYFDEACLHRLRVASAEQGRRQEYDAYVPIHEGLIEPLCAVYHKRCTEAFAKCLETDVLKLSEAFGMVRVKFVQVGAGTGLEDLSFLRNLNTPENLTNEF